MNPHGAFFFQPVSADIFVAECQSLVFLISTDLPLEPFFWGRRGLKAGRGGIKCSKPPPHPSPLPQGEGIVCINGRLVIISKLFMRSNCALPQSLSVDLVSSKYEKARGFAGLHPLVSESSTAWCGSHSVGGVRNIPPFQYRASVGTPPPTLAHFFYLLPHNR